MENTGICWQERQGHRTRRYLSSPGTFLLPTRSGWTVRAKLPFRFNGEVFRILSPKYAGRRISTGCSLRRLTGRFPCMSAMSIFLRFSMCCLRGRLFFSGKRTAFIFSGLRNSRKSCVPRLSFRCATGRWRMFPSLYPKP